MQPKNEKSENVKVAVRIRPLTANELLSDAKQVFFSSQQDAIIYIENQNKQFTFDYVFGPDSTQEQIYSNSIVPLLDKFKNGFNTTIIAYGQTGSGKTFSMGTDKLVQSELQSDLDGVIPRVIRSLFSCLSSTNNPTGFKYSVSTSFLELHNEDLVDLLNPRPKSAGSWGGLLIREDSNGNIIWTGVREELVDGPEACLQSLQKGSLCRTTGSTDMNVSSSRSHAIFSIILKQEVWTPYDNVGNIPIQKEFDPVNFPDGTWTVYNSKFHFVDLAGI